ncbi:MAG: folylpolyglutamate synthase/dihydrofolate synthase family protein [Alistipes sp.]|nr:folylpolyglutamate synthase/dihydrofolate synthase family protein [Alistipes sp.]
MNYTQTLDFLFTAMPSFQRVGGDAYKPGLERIAAFCQHMGNPQRNYYTIHVAGTNGKGSVSHILASILREAGYRTGLFTSPHLVDFRERIRVDGEMMPKQKVVNFVDKHREKMQELDLSFFEMTAAMAFDYFAQSDVEVAIIETGLGGRLDATNLIVPMLSVVTNIGMEHTEFLGDTIEKIAAEKAGIIKKSIPVVIGQGSDAYNAVFEQRAEEMRSKVIYAEQEFLLEGIEHFDDRNQHFSVLRTRDNRAFELDIDLLGDYQRHNIITACAAADFLAEQTPLTISRRAFREGIARAAANTGLMGRWQVIADEPYTVCDTGHNADGMRFVASQLESLNVDRIFAVMGFAKEKSLEKIMPLLPKKVHYIFTKANIDRARAIEDVAAFADSLGLDYECQPTVKDAVARARSLALASDAIFIGGSNFVVAEVEGIATSEE